ncbi:MAG: hypothetical protein HQ488_02515 [Parcubacteria group bacterium]|nr:hypothetical protein [Parcubacteria group bacterium]
MHAATVYSGPPTSHPDATRIGTWTGWIQNQYGDMERAIRKAFRGDPSGLTGEIILEMDDDTLIKGSVTGHVGLLRGNDTRVRMLLARWDQDIFQHAIVEIELDGRITVIVRENPPEQGQEFRPASPMVCQPD